MVILIGKHLSKLLTLQKIAFLKVDGEGVNSVKSGQWATKRDGPNAISQIEIDLLGYIADRKGVPGVNCDFGRESHLLMFSVFICCFH